MVETYAQIEREPAVDFPVVLNIELDIPVIHVESGGGAVLGVAVYVTKQGVREAVVGIQQGGRTGRGKTKGARIIAIRRLILFVVLDIDSGLKRVVPGRLGQVIGVVRRSD